MIATGRRRVALVSVLMMLGACGDEEPGPAQEPTPQESEPQAAPTSGEGTVVVEEDFEADAGPFAQAIGSGSIAAQDGKLAVDPEPGAGPIVSHVTVDPPAQIVRIEAQVGSTADTFAMAGCATSTPGTEYRFTVGPGNSSAIYRWEDGEMTELGRGAASFLDIAGSIDFRAECLGQGPGLPTRLILYDCSECEQIAVDVEDPQGLGDFTSVYLGGEELEGEGGLASFDDVRITRY